MFDGAGRFAATRLLGAIGSPSRYTSSTIDSVAKVLIPKLMAGREGLVPAVDFETTTLLLVIGENMVVSHGGFSYFPDPVRYLRSVERRGEVWVFDPRRTETARLATRHLTARPGTDFAFLGHLVRELLRVGADTDYLARHARRVDELRGVVEPFDRESTSHLTGLAVEDLVALLAAVRRHRRLAIVTGTGVTMAATGNVTEWMAYALQIVTGSFERPGRTLVQSHRDGRTSEHRLSGYVRIRAGSAEVTPRSPAWPTSTRARCWRRRSSGAHVRALLVTGGNPLTAFPQPDRLRRAFDQLDVLAVWDLVRSATAERATHLFPCPDPLERADLVVPIHLSMVFAQYTSPVIPARAGRRPMWWSLAKVAEGMGLSILPGDVAADACSDEDVFASMVAGTPVSWDSLLKAEGRFLQFPRQDRWVERTVLPEGRWDLAPTLLMERLEHALSRPSPGLVLGNRREVQHTNSTLAWGVGGAPRSQPYVYLSPDDAAAVGVDDGGAVEVRSRHGALFGTARFDSALAPGTVVVPHGFSEPNVGHLSATDVDVDPLTGMPTLVGVPVSIRPQPRSPASVESQSGQ